MADERTLWWSKLKCHGVRPLHLTSLQSITRQTCLSKYQYVCYMGIVTNDFGVVCTLVNWWSDYNYPYAKGHRVKHQSVSTITTKSHCDGYCSTGLWLPKPERSLGEREVHLHNDFLIVANGIAMQLDNTERSLEYIVFSLYKTPQLTNERAPRFPRAERSLGEVAVHLHNEHWGPMRLLFDYPQLKGHWMEVHSVFTENPIDQWEKSVSTQDWKVIRWSNTESRCCPHYIITPGECPQTQFESCPRPLHSVYWMSSCVCFLNSEYYSPSVLHVPEIQLVNMSLLVYRPKTPQLLLQNMTAQLWVKS